MNTTKNDIYIKILKYANENPGFSYQQIMNAFPDQEKLIKKQLIQTGSFIDVSPKSDQYMLSFESRFRLLEYEELNEARKSSRRAMFIAIASILITLFSIVCSILFVQSVEVVNFEKGAQIIEKQKK